MCIRDRNYSTLLILQMHLCLTCSVDLTGTDFALFSSILVAIFYIPKHKTLVCIPNLRRITIFDKKTN